MTSDDLEGLNSKKRRKLMGYEQHPPRCINCQHFDPPVHGVPGVTFFKTSSCLLGEFQTGAQSICDHWVGINGEKLL